MTKTKREIIIETAKYYAKNPNRRGVVAAWWDPHPTCCYCTDDGKMCAVGRCLIDPVQMEDSHGGETVKGKRKDWLDRRLKEEYRGHAVRFWRELQEFHDCHANWTTDGLSHTGVEAFANLLANYGE